MFSKLWERYFGKRRKNTARSGPPAGWRNPPPEWRKEFAERREAFLGSFRDATEGASHIESREFGFDEDEGKYRPFVHSEDGKLVSQESGGAREAEAYLRHMIDQGHKVAFAVQRDGPKAKVCVSYDGDQLEWTPTWPDDFRVDASGVSTPMTSDW